MINAQTDSRPPPTHNTPALFSLGVGEAANAEAAAVAEVAWLCSCPSEATIAGSIISAQVAGELVQLLHLPPGHCCGHCLSVAVITALVAAV